MLHLKAGKLPIIADWRLTETKTNKMLVGFGPLEAQSNPRTNTYIYIYRYPPFRFQLSGREDVASCGFLVEINDHELILDSWCTFAPTS